MALAVLVVACGSNDDSTTAASEADAPTPARPAKVTMGAALWVGASPWYVAEALNLDQQYGIDLKVKTLLQQQDWTPAWVSGGIQAASAVQDLAGQMLVANSGKTVAVANKSDGADKIVGTMNSLSELPGHSFGFKIDEYTAAFVLPALKEAGVNLDDVDVVPLGFADGPPALAAGKIDATASFEPLISNALADNPDANVLYSTKGSNTIVESIIVTDQLAENPAVVEQLLKVYQAAVQELRNNPKEAEAAAAKATQTPIKDYKIALAGAKIYDLQESQGLIESGDYLENARRLFDVFAEAGRIDNPEEFTQAIKESIDTDYAATALSDGSD